MREIPQTKSTKRYQEGLLDTQGQIKDKDNNHHCSAKGCQNKPKDHLIGIDLSFHIISSLCETDADIEIRNKFDESFKIVSTGTHKLELVGIIYDEGYNAVKKFEATAYCNSDLSEMQFPALGRVFTPTVNQDISTIIDNTDHRLSLNSRGDLGIGDLKEVKN